MDDGFDEIFDEDEALDYALLEEVEKEEGKVSKSGCLGILIIFVGVISAMTFAIQNL